MDLEFLGDSSCVSAAGFKAGYLTVQFQDGTMYTYTDVSPQVWVAFKRSTSKGWYFNTSIRNRYSFFEGSAPDSGPLKYIDEKYFNDLVEEGVEELPEAL